jgi:uncharacterized protein DUF6328
MDEREVETERVDEPESTRLARNMAELLQELRVAQAGVQILFAFLLSVAFTNRFASATAFQRVTVIITVLLTTASSALLMAPVAWHRLYFRQGRRPDVIRWGNRFALGGLGLLAAAMTGAVLLVADAVAGRVPAIVMAACAAVLFGSTWIVLPLVRRARTPNVTPPPRQK